jgi:uracil-DNA glycosylase
MKSEDSEPATRRPPPQQADEGALSEARSVSTVEELHHAVNDCRRCPLWKSATQAVPGEGMAPSPLMLLGESPGDSEDQKGHPFVGPAGAVLDRALQQAGLSRDAVYLSNCVKHFKFEQRGQRRLHIKPTPAEIEACHWWLSEELRIVSPKLVMALGGTAARSLLGHPVIVSQVRAQPTRLTPSMSVWVTVHPSFLLRVPDEAQRQREFDRFVQELRDALEWTRQH